MICTPPPPTPVSLTPCQVWQLALATSCQATSRDPATAHCRGFSTRETASVWSRAIGKVILLEGQGLAQLAPGSVG